MTGIIKEVEGNGKYQEDEAVDRGLGWLTKQMRGDEAGSREKPEWMRCRCVDNTERGHQ